MTTPPQRASEVHEDHDGLWNQLGNAVALVAKEDQIVWTIFGIFWAANALLLGALFVTGKVPDRVVGLIISGSGAALCLMWSLIQSRALRFLSFYEAVQKNLESKLLNDALDVALSPTLNQTTFDRAPGTNVSARRVMVTSSIASTILWAIGLSVFVCRR